MRVCNHGCVGGFYALDMPSRLKGIETLIPTQLCCRRMTLDMVSRLKGIETCYRYIQARSTHTLDMPSRLKRIETFRRILFDARCTSQIASTVPLPSSSSTIFTIFVLM